MENPYWQVFTGETYLQTEPLIDPSSLTRWRKRLGEAGDEELLAETIEAARRAGVISVADANRAALQDLIGRTKRIVSEKPKDKNKLYALHAPEVECISKGKARQPYEFGVKVSITTTYKEGLVVGMRLMPGNPYDGHTLAEALGQAAILSDA